MTMNASNPWHEFHGPNLGYLLEQYDLYLMNPNDVDESLRELFVKWGAPQADENTGVSTPSPQGLSPSYIVNKMKKLASVLTLAENIRSFGHLEANIFPLEEQAQTNLLTLAHYGLTEADVREIPVELICPDRAGRLADGLAAIEYLKQVYTGTIGYEVEHVDLSERAWLRNKIESDYYNQKFSSDRKTELLKKLYEAEGFEQFIHKTYIGQKRFSVEGLETMVPAVEELVALSAEEKIDNVVIAMAHRGRLNILAHVLQKPYEALFSQFQHSKWEIDDSDYSETVGSTGDVKYHLGAVKRRTINGNTVTVTLANNPSHLEFSGTVAEGYARAAQDDRSQKGYPSQDVTKALPVLIHGDAAFAGQGIVFEILNYAQTKAYYTGGTIHLIANNCIGFTTEMEDSRSTRYSSDPAKGYNIPVFHVNADDPEAAITTMQLAFDYRNTFHKDVLIDLIGYRRLGHNEMDEPRATSPLIYQKVDKHPTITAVYKNKLIAEKSITEEEIQQLEKATTEAFKAAYGKIDKTAEEVPSIAEMQKQGHYEFPTVDTSVDKATLEQINRELLKYPEGFHVFSKLKKILGRRLDVFEKKGKIDWGHGEVLAFATILKDGTPIRITGEDSERGTFSHRNIVLSDEKTGEKYSPLHTISTSNASFAVHNSTLSEAAILGFEYGYNVFAPETLVFWEAQFGDFANGAQVIIDQFIAAGKAKWGQTSGLVMLLPHGYEGQGPEHSSARLERFLQMAAENNWTVANLSSSAQYFHILRRQAALLKTKEIRPLVIMAPKSLLRNQAAGSYIEEFTNGSFQAVIEQPGLGTEPGKVERVVFCTGRLAVEIGGAFDEPKDYPWLDVVRVEELYPFPEKEIQSVLAKYKNLKEVIWVQEEPKNMGAWNYIAPRLQEIVPDSLKVSYIGRPEMSSPSEGDPSIHKKEQQRIISEALTKQAKKIDKETVKS
ncbi:2-oxoglutarate dehydrogenase E1 component [Caldibacillus lycopersici]|uniref:2-oxoglutarate dehydrogenase E1 component n=1 Tax=Perspicuibacillus lycopersici TaxID=1325689 RepID=A0AAE3IVT8_9BACI|nr:2-oxoglutarate dehydrogenase E1 component [Perspicuibacillus lycopersici]MCU9613005.1 2-oxoglutarate dehydrogenase E1 component [Perspicuibacillus lycopersici]